MQPVPAQRPFADGRVIGLSNEIRGLEDWIANPDATALLFSVSGIGGIGKTTLLIEMSRKAASSSIRTLWVDGHGDLSTPGAFLTSLESLLAHEYGMSRTPDEPLLTAVVAELARQRTVLLIDNGDGIERLEGWLLSSFLPKLEQARVLIVAASRTGLPARWLTNPHWGARIRSYPLQLFTREEVRDYLRDSGFAEDVQAELARRTDGHPLLLALTVDWLRSRQGAERSALRDLPSLLGAELLREVASPALYRALIALSLLPAADRPTLNRLLDSPIGESDYDSLGKLSFIRATPHGLTMHHVASRLLREEYAGSSPGPFRLLRQRAFRLLAEQFHAVDARQQMRYAAHVLELYREFLPTAHAYANFASAVRASEHYAFEPSDLPRLQQLLAASAVNWQSELARAEDYHLLLEDIAERSPEGICVVRDDRGMTLAFCAGVWMHGQTVPLLERYAPGFQTVLEDELERLHRLPPEDADSLFVLLAAVDVEHPQYRPEELGALLMQQWVIRMTGGLRGVMVTADPQLQSLLPLLGFRQSGTIGLPGAAAEAALTKWELDFRQSAFDDWVQRVIRHTGPADSEPTDRPEAPATIDEREMKLILRHLHEPGPLGRLPVIRRLRSTGEEARRKVLDLLTAEHPSPPLTETEQRILRELHVRRERGKEELARAFYMSRTTFYRHSVSAVRHLADALSRSYRSDEASCE